MYGPLALILIAAGVFLGLMVRHDPSSDPARIASSDQFRGFGLVGAGALITLGAVVVIVGVLAPPDGTAESLGVLALFGFLLYLIVAGVVIMITRITAARRWGPPAASAPAQQFGDGHAGRDGTGQPADHRGGDQP
jgi:hypothetical protein